MNITVNKNDLIKYGFLKLNIPHNINLVKEIEQLRKEKNAIILAHYYQDSNIQDIADFVGDSLALAQKAENTNAEIILMAGVHFMAETVKILNPEKKVIVPDLKAGCSLANSCPIDDFKRFMEKYPEHTVISYVNTTAEIKSVSDIICTSSNAINVVNSIDKSNGIIFAPDKNLGNYISSVTGREMIIWNGACHVHEEFSLERILNLKKQYTNAKIIAHPECEKPVLIASDYIGSTAALLKYVQIDGGSEYIVATESGILHQMKKVCPGKLFIPAPPNDSTCACNDCNFMKLNSIEKIFVSLKYELPEIILDREILTKAYNPIKRMLEISESLKL